MFIFDPNKAISNYLKHGISFENAATIFIDEFALEWTDVAHSDKELRFKRLGKTLDGCIIIIVYTHRRGLYGEENIRIISERKANKKERQTYCEKKAQYED